MRQRASERLKAVRGLEELEQAIRDLCGELGRVKRLDLIPDAEAGCVVCRLEPSSPRDGDAFVQEFGGIIIGSGVYFDIPDASRMTAS